MKNKCLSSRLLAGFGSKSADLVIALSFQRWSVDTSVLAALHHEHNINKTQRRLETAVR